MEVNPNDPIPMKVVKSKGRDNDYYIGFNGEVMPQNARIVEQLQLVDSSLTFMNCVLEIKQPLMMRHTHTEEDMLNASLLLGDYDHTLLVTVAVKI